MPKKIYWLFFFSLLATFSILAQSPEKEEIAIEQVLVNSYLKPIFQKGDLNKLEDGFHEGFHLYVKNKGELSTRTRTEWIRRIKKNTALRESTQDYTWDIAMIDITNETAMAKVMIKLNGKLKYVDYIGLYKFGETWKIVSKQYSIF